MGKQTLDVLASDPTRVAGLLNRLGDLHPEAEIGYTVGEHSKMDVGGGGLLKVLM